MDRTNEERLDAVFRVFDEQHRISKQWPYAPGRIQRDKELSSRLSELIDRLTPGGNVGNRAPRE